MSTQEEPKVELSERDQKLCTIAQQWINTEGHPEQRIIEHTLLRMKHEAQLQNLEDEEVERHELATSPWPEHPMFHRRHRPRVRNSQIYEIAAKLLKEIVYGGRLRNILLQMAEQERSRREAELHWKEERRERLQTIEELVAAKKEIKQLKKDLRKANGQARNRKPAAKKVQRGH